MPLTKSDLKKIEELAYLDSEADEHNQLVIEISAIMDFVEQLRKVDTHQIAPLFHPLDMHQRFREDEVTERDCRRELAEIAEFFEDGLYLVPKIINSGQ